MDNNFSLKVEHLTYSYNNKTILEDINWTLHSGHIYVLLAPNGTGKTTFINLLADVLHSNIGDISIVTNDGKVLHEFHEYIGYLTEFPYDYPFLNIVEMIKLVGNLKNIESDRLEKDMKKWIQYLGLEDYCNNTMASLSQGTKKRVNFIASIIHQPKIIFLDEPTNGLDPEQVILFRSILKELASNGALILLSTHIIGLAEELADYVGIMKNKRLVYTGKNEGALEELYLKV